MWEIGLVAAVFFLSAGGTDLVRKIALAHALLDIPNDRSLHDQPTPHGGGVAIAVAFFAALVVVWWQQLISGETLAALIGGGGLVAIIGGLDDHYDLSSKWRLLVQGLAAVWVLYCWGGFSSLSLGTVTIPLGVVGPVLAWLAIVWLINLYNFMDGSDGFAGVQGLCAGVAGSVVFELSGEPGLALVSAALAAASAGFLILNWAPAKIFMGDSGSYLLGFSYAVLALEGERRGAVPALLWTIFLGIFVWDSSLTLVRRFAAGEMWYAAHRSHAYQRLVLLGMEPGRLAWAALAINVLVLWPMGLWAFYSDDFLLLAVILTGLFLGGIWLAVDRRYSVSI